MPLPLQRAPLQGTAPRVEQPVCRVRTGKRRGSSRVSGENVGWDIRAHRDKGLLEKTRGLLAMLHFLVVHVSLIKPYALNVNPKPLALNPKPQTPVRAGPT